MVRGSVNSDYLWNLNNSLLRSPLGTLCCSITVIQRFLVLIAKCTLHSIMWLEQYILTCVVMSIDDLIMCKSTIPISTFPLHWWGWKLPKHLKNCEILTSANELGWCHSNALLMWPSAERKCQMGLEIVTLLHERNTLVLCEFLSLGHWSSSQQCVYWVHTWGRIWFSGDCSNLELWHQHCLTLTDGSGHPLTCCTYPCVGSNH